MVRLRAQETRVRQKNRAANQQKDGGEAEVPWQEAAQWQEG